MREVEELGRQPKGKAKHRRKEKGRAKVEAVCGLGEAERLKGMDENKSGRRHSLPSPQQKRCVVDFVVLVLLGEGSSQR